MNETPLITMELTQREAALVNLCRSMRHGTIEKLSVSAGEPDVVVCVSQRIELRKGGERTACESLPVDFGHPLANKQGEGLRHEAEPE